MRRFAADRGRNRSGGCACKRRAYYSRGAGSRCGNPCGYYSGHNHNRPSCAHNHDNHNNNHYYTYTRDRYTYTSYCRPDPACACARAGSACSGTGNCRPHNTHCPYNFYYSCNSAGADKQYHHNHNNDHHFNRPGCAAGCNPPGRRTHKLRFVAKSLVFFVRL